MLAAFRSAFSSFPRVASAIVIAAMLLAIAIWFPNIGLLRIILEDGSIGSGRKAGIALALLGSLGTNFTPLSAASVVLSVALVGINAVLAYHLVRRSRGQRMGTAAASGTLGIMAGIFGVGCAACGSVIATAALGTVAGAGILSFLPLGGQEFGLVGIALLAASTYALLKRISEPLVCPVGNAKQ